MGVDGNYLRNIAKNVNDFKSNLNYGWQAEEMINVNKAIDNINKELLRLASDLDSINSDIVQVVEEIKREDKAKAAQRVKIKK